MPKSNDLNPDDLYMEADLHGAAMRNELVLFYNKFVYWCEAHSKVDAEKKRLDSLLEIVKDKAKKIKSEQALRLDYKAKIQEAYIRDIWDTEVEMDSDWVVTPAELVKRLSKVVQEETRTRHKMNMCSAGLDIGRTAVAFDKVELSNIKSANF